MDIEPREYFANAQKELFLILLITLHYFFKKILFTMYIIIYQYICFQSWSSVYVCVCVCVCMGFYGGSDS